MELIVIKNQTEVKKFNFPVQDLANAFNHLYLANTFEYVQEIKQNNYAFILKDSANRREPIAVYPSMFTTKPISEYDQLIIIKEISGDFPLIIVAVVVMAEIALDMAVADIIIGLVVSIAVYAISKMLTPHTQVDPTNIDYLSRSNLFTGAQLVSAQGVPVPLVYGQAYCGGILIDSSNHTVQGF